jgi:hypothetical protein
MTRRENRDGGKGGAQDHAARSLTDDLDALRTMTSRDLPPLASMLTSMPVTKSATMPATNISARGRAPTALPGGILMNALRKAKMRPWLATGLGTAAVALVLLFIPVSYDRLIGSELTLRLGSAEIAPSALREIASDLRTKLGAEKIRVDVDAAPQGGTPNCTTLTAEIPDASWRRVSRLAIEYARGLAERGIQAAPRVRPRFEKAHGNVYAAIGNLAEIRIQTEGKSDQEIAAEIQGQLSAAGLTDATVEVNRQDGRTEIRIEAKKTAIGDEGAADGPCCPELRITLDGQEPGSPQIQTQKCEVRVQRTEGTTDQQVIDDVKRQLQEQGVNDAQVSFDENGKIQIKRPGQ